MKDRNRRTEKMKGYDVEIGYMGFVDGEYRPFACEEDYESGE